MGEELSNITKRKAARMLSEKMILVMAALILAGTVTGCSAVQPLLQAVGIGRAASIVQSQLDARQRAKERQRLQEERKEREAEMAEGREEAAEAERNRRGETMAEARRREVVQRKSPQEQIREYEEERRRLIKAQEKQQAEKLARERPGRAKEALVGFKMQWGPVPEEMGLALAYWWEGDFENGDRFFEIAKRKSDRTSEWEAGALASRKFWKTGR